jgi:L-lactate dehydrogenase complex protein LldG
MPTNDRGDREAILARIRQALEKPVSAPAPATRSAPVFAPVADPLERFKTECAANMTELVLVPDAEAAAEAIANTLGSLPPGELFIQDLPELRAMAGRFGGGRGVRWSSEGSPRETTQASLTLAEALVALTGSIFVSAGCGGRAASVAPDCHIVLARQSQLVPDLETAFARIEERKLPERYSFLGLITGSSRTADIEKILVLGAHGPRRLVCILQTDS